MIIGSETLREDAMPLGTDPASTAEVETGTFTISDSSGLPTIVSVTINGVQIPIGSLAGSTIPGVYGNLFIVSYNPNTGEGVYQYTLTAPFTHNDAQDQNNAALAEEVEIPAESFVFTVSDGIGSSAPATLHINIVDDEPQIQDIVLNVETLGAVTVEADETVDKGDRYAAGDDQATDGNPNTDDAGAGIGQVTSTFAGGLQALFGATVLAGADGLASQTVQVAFGGFPPGGAGVATNLSAIEGGAISLFLEGGAIVGRDTAADEVFRIDIVDVNPDPAITELQFQLTLFEAIEHPDNAKLDEALELFLNDQTPIQLVATVTVVDGDGDFDTLTESFNLITGQSTSFYFDDDGPKIKADAQPVERVVGENDIFTLLSFGSSPDFGAERNDSDQSYTGLGGGAVVSGALGGLVDFGSDGAAAGGGFRSCIGRRFSIPGPRSGIEGPSAFLRTDHDRGQSGARRPCWSASRIYVRRRAGR